MTTTDVYKGMNTEGKPSSRVLAPPGGGGSDIFGTGLGTAPADAPRTGKGCLGNSRNQSSVLGGTPDAPNTPTRAPRPDDRSGQNLFGEPDSKPPPPPRQDESIFAPASTSNQPKPAAKNQGVNPITGQSPSGEGAARDRTQSTKARAGVNPITGESYGPKKDVHTSISIKQPPGGASSGLW